MRKFLTRLLDPETSSLNRFSGRTPDNLSLSRNARAALAQRHHTLRPGSVSLDASPPAPEVVHRQMEVPDGYCNRLYRLWDKALQEVRNPPLPEGDEVGLLFHGPTEVMHFASARTADGYRSGMTRTPGLGPRMNALVSTARAIVALVDSRQEEKGVRLADLDNLLSETESLFSLQAKPK